METRKKKVLSRMVLIMNGFLFLMGGILLIEEGKVTNAVFQIFTALLNFFMLVRLRNSNVRKSFEYALYLMNIAIALMIAFDYIQMGKKYIQFVWLLTAALTLVALIIHMRKSKKASGDS